MPEVISSEKKANHRANIIKIIEGIVRAHPDPETTDLELIDIPGTSYQVVVRKGQFSIGDLGVFIQPDSLVPTDTKPFEFLGGHARITVRKFRKQWSEGLLLPVVDFEQLVDERGNLKQTFAVGSDVSEVLGITHYDPDAGKEGTNQATGKSPKKKFKYPRSLRGWLGLLRSFVRNKGQIREITRDVPFVLPVYDVEALKNYAGAIRVGEQVVVTEKIHGSNARFIWLDGEFYVGSRNQWKAKEATGPWGAAVRDNPWIEAWCREHEGYALYGEIAPTQAEGGVKFDYGAAKDKTRFFAFDVLVPDGGWLEWDKFYSALVAGQVTESITVPVLYEGPFLPAKILPLVDGPSTVHGAKHIREGLVIKTTTEQHVRGLGRAQLKVVSNAFLDLNNRKK